MTNYDPRLELARRLANSRRTNTPLNLGNKIVVPSSGITDPKTRDLYNQVSDTGLSISQQNPDLAAQVKAIGGNKPTSSLGKLARAGLGVVTVIDTPMRAVISGVREVVDVLDSDPNTKGSLSDWSKQTRDPTYRFGTAFPMKGNWGRFVGLVGDIGLDPLTYVTAGAKGTATFGQRFALYNTIRAKGISAEVAGQFLQRGKTALTKAGVTSDQLAEMGLKRSGMYMFGSKLRIPLSGPVGEMMLSGTSRARIGFTSTRFGEVLQKGFMGTGKNQEEWIRAFRLALARNEPLPLNLLKGAEDIAGIPARDVAVGMLNANTAREAASSVAQKEFAIRAGMKLNEIGPENIEAYRNTVYQVMEGTRVASSPAEQKLANDLAEVYASIWDQVAAKGKQVDPEWSKNFVKEFFPWVITDDARKISTDLLETPWVKDLQTVLEPNPLDLQGSFKSRTVKEGTKWFWTVENGVKKDYILKAGDINITRLNEISRNAIGVDFWKTDAAEVLGRHYVDSAADHMGLLAMIDDIHKSGTMRTVLKEAGVHADMVNAQAASMSAIVDIRIGAMKDLEEAIAKVVKPLNDYLKQSVKGLEAVVARSDEELAAAALAASRAGFVSPVGTADKVISASVEGAITPTALASAKRELTNAKSALTKLRGQFDTVFETDIPHLAVAANEKLDSIISTVDDLEIAIAEWQSQADALGRSGSATQGQITKTKRALSIAGTELQEQQAKATASLKEVLDSANVAMAGLNDSIQAYEEFVELSNIFATKMDKIIDGKVIKGFSGKRVRSIIAGGSRGKDSLENFATEAGALNAWIGKNIGDLDFFKEIQGSLGATNVVTKSGVKTMTLSEVYDIIASGGGDVASTLESINAAAFVMARDVKFYASREVVDGVSRLVDNTPEHLVRLRNELMELVKPQADLVGFVQRAKMGDKVAKEVLVARTEIRKAELVLGKAEGALQDHVSLDVFSEYASGQMIRGEVDGNMNFNEWLSDTTNQENIIDDLGDEIWQDKEFTDLWMSLPEDTTLLDVVKLSKRKYVDLQASFEIARKENAEVSLRHMGIKDTSLTVNGRTMKFTPQQMSEFTYVTEANSKELTDRLAAYTMVSEVERRYNALGQEFVAMGAQAPTDGMHTAIMRKVAGEHLENVRVRENLVSRARATLETIREQYETVLGESKAIGYNGEGPVAALDRLFEEAYLAEPEAMNKTFGSIIKFSSDVQRYEGRIMRLATERTEQFNIPLKKFFEENPGALRGITKEEIESLTAKGVKVAIDSNARVNVIKRIVSEDFDHTIYFTDKEFELFKTKAHEFLDIEKRTRGGKTDFIADHLRPWFNEVQPYTNYTTAAARRALKVHVPLSDEYSIKRFFVDQLGGIRRSSASTMEKNLGAFPVGARRSPMLAKSPSGNIISMQIQGALNVELGTIRSRSRHIVDVLDPSSSLDKFLLDPFGLPTGPFSHLENLTDWSKELGRQIERISGLESVKTVKTLEKESAKVGVAARSVEATLAETDPTATKAARTSRFVDTPENEQEIAAAIRKMRARHDRLVATPEYAVAIHDQEMTQVLEKLASVNGYAVTDLRTGEAGWVIAPKSGKIKLADYGLDDTILAEKGLASNYYNIQDAVGDFTPDSYLVSPDGKRVINVDQSSNAIKRKLGTLRTKTKLLIKSEDPSNDELIERMLKEINDLDLTKWRHVKLTKLTGSEEVDVSNVFKLFTEQTPIDKLEGEALIDSTLFGSVTGEQSATNIADIVPDIKFATENKVATFLDPDAASKRREVANYLFANDVIDDRMVAMLNSNKPISDVLETMIKLPDNSSTTLNDIILNSGLGGELETVSKLTGLEGRLSFSENEWNSLFAVPFSAGEKLKVTNQVRSLNSQLNKLRTELQSGRTMFTETVDGKVVSRQIAKRIKELETKIAGLDIELKVRDNVTQSTALVKYQQLFDQFNSVRVNADNELARWRAWADEGLETVDIPNGKGGFNTVNVAKKLEGLEKVSSQTRNLNNSVDNYIRSRTDNVVTGETIKSRREGLQRSWQSTQSSKVIAQVDAINASPEMEFFKNKRTTLSRLLNTKAEVDGKIRLARSNLSYTEKDLVGAAQQIIKTVGEFDGGDLSTVKPLMDSLRNAFVIDAENNVLSVKYEGLSKEIPRATKNLIAEIQDSFPEPLSLFTVDLERVQKLQQAVDVERFDVFKSSFLVAQETLRTTDALSPYKVQLANLRTRLITLNEKQAAEFAQREALLKRIADAIGISEETRATIQKDWVDGYSLTKKGKPSTGPKAIVTPGKIPAAEQRVIEAQSLYNYISSEYNSILPRYQIAEDVNAAIQLEVKPKIAEMQRLIDEKVKRGRVGVRAETKTKKYKNVTTVNEANIAEFQKWIKEASDAVDASALKPDDTLSAVLAEAARAQTVYSNALLRENYLTNLNQMQLYKAFDRNVTEEIAKRANEAWVTLEKIGLPGIEAPQEIVNMFGELRRFKEPAFSKGFGQFLDTYTRFFKRYATLSPGFHIRNAMTNSFALVAAGGDLRNFPTGLRLYREMEAALNSGTTFDNWVKSIANPVERGHAELAGRSMFAAGGGQTEEYIGKYMTKSDNYLVGKSRTVGGKIENSARFMLGYDSAVKGFDFNVAAARTKRFLFDYEDIGQLDRGMKQIIPFWMWTSRALPLHLMNMIVNPKPYQVYRSFERNFKVKDDINLTPDWVDQVGGFKITQGTYLMPDLGFNKIPETLSQLNNPAKLLANVNPVLRVPLELAANKQFYNNRQFSDKPKDVSDAGAANLLLPLLEALGKAGTNAEGKQVANEKALYALSALFPTFGQAERLLPSSPSGKSNFLGYLGVPLRGETESMKQGSLYEKLNELTKLKNSQGM